MLETQVGQRPTVESPKSPSLCGRAIETLLGKIDSGAYDVLSLDVFDTLVWRKVPRPTDAFFAMGARLLKAFPEAPADAELYFADERQVAEARARVFCNRNRECRIEEIYAVFPLPVFRDAAGRAPDIATAVANEIAVEREMARLDEEVVALAERARARGMRIVLVSDTYFSPEQLAEIVAPFKADMIATSAQYGKSKFMGLLGDVARQLGVAPGRILHVGDNPMADEAGARMAGTDYGHWRKGSEWSERAIERELPMAAAARRRYLGEDGQDRGLTRLRNRVAHGVAQEGGDIYAQFGAAVVGPVVACFNQWLIRRLRQLGARDVFLLLREGRIIREFLEPFEPGFTCHELPASRYLGIKACFDGSGQAYMEFFMRQQAPLTMAQVCRQLGVAPLFARTFPAGPDTPIVGEELTRAAIHYLMQPKISLQVQAEAQHLRRSMVELIGRHVDLGTTKTLYVVDLGYSGTIQRMLRKVLAMEGYDITVHGLYMMTFSGAFNVHLEGGYIEGMLSNGGHPLEELAAFYRSPEVLEQTFMPMMGSSVGFDAAGEPQFGPLDIDERQFAQTETVRVGVRRFLQAWLSLPERPWDGSRDPGLMRYLRRILERSVDSPEPEEVEAFRGWHHDQNMGSSDVAQLISQSGLEEVRWRSAAALCHVPRGDIYWPHAASALVAPSQHQLLRYLLREEARHDHRVEEADWKAFLFWDDGNGFGHQRAVTTAFDLNALGRSTIAFAFQAQGAVEGLALSIKAADVLSIDRWVVRAGGIGAAFGRDDLARCLQGDGMSRLGQDLWRREREDLPMLYLPLPARLGPSKRVDVEIRVRMLPQ